jgi:hypothetical protein
MIPFFRPSLSTWAGGILLAASVTAVFLHHREVVTLRDRLEVVTAERDSANRRYAGAQLAVNACMQVNLENSQERDRIAKRYKDAEARIVEAEQDANHAIQVMRSEIARLRGRDMDCSALDNTFRDWMFTDSPD